MLLWTVENKPAILYWIGSIETSNRLEIVASFRTGTQSLSHKYIKIYKKHYLETKQMSMYRLKEWFLLSDKHV